MRLKKVILHGFKSFADRTSLQFSEGITCIVGPNGCGKSNISDAFRWVMGEQSAKSLRGSRMPDVIFAGTSSRKPMNFSEVTLVLSNDDQSLPIEYDEVAITRKLHRSGESEYLINRNPVRLKDIQGLFLDTGIGKNSYAIFEQGKIDQVINYGPQERRFIFEEAAGILRFLINKRKTHQRLQQTDQNMSRVGDIHREVFNHMELLGKQAEEAKNYKANQNRFAELEKSILVHKWMQFQEKESSLSNEDHTIEDLLKDMEFLLEILQHQLDLSKRDLSTLEEEARKKNEAVYKAQSSKEISQKELESRSKRLQEAKKEEKKILSHLEELQQRRTVSRSVFDKNQCRLKELQSFLEQARKDWEASQEAYEEGELELQNLRQQQQNTHQSRLQAVQREGELRSQFEKSEFRLENLCEKFNHGRKQLEKTLTLHGQQAEQLSEKQKELAKASEEVDGFKNMTLKLQEQVNEIGKSIQEKEQSLESKLRTFTEASARYKALRRLQEEMEGFSKGTKHLLQLSQGKDTPLSGKIQGLFELLRPQDGKEKELASAMRPYTQTLVVQTELDLTLLLDYAREHQISDFSVLCLDHLSTSESCSSPSFASFVSPAPLSAHFLSHLRHVSRVEEGLQEASPAVVEGGALIDEHRVLFFPALGENNAFLREAEIQQLSESIEILDQECQSLDAQVQKQRTEQAAWKEELLALDQKMRRSEMKLVEVNFSVQQIKKEFEELHSRKEYLQRENQSAEKEIGELKEKIEILQEQHEEAKEGLVQSQKLQGDLDIRLEELQTVVRKQREVFRSHESTYQKVQEEEKQLSHVLELHQVKDDESQRQQESYLERLEELRNVKHEHDDEETGLGKTVQEAEAQLSQATQENLAAQEFLKNSKEHIEHIESNRSWAQKRAQELGEQRAKMGIKKAQASSGMESIEKDLEERHHLSIEDALKKDFTLDLPLEEAEKELRSLRKAISSAGDINLASIEEYEQHKVRHEFLQKQIDDLEGSKEELLKMIEELDAQSRKLFQVTFDQVRANFKKNFAVLFRGGEADLTFTDNGDILEAGIEIIAKPPGKQMRSIHLLSGGEKCLTAMALLFAIFEVKSAPFCILDEIDAPLDDTNVDRFVRMVQQFTEKCQFLIITHNKCTMAIADRMFGVSMQEKGVSTLLRMEFSGREEEEKQVAIAQV